jgi:CRISPR-associated protein Cmr3
MGAFPVTTTDLFIEPVDVLMFRGNKLFGGPGSFGESLMPPWPSAVAGAIRSALLAYKRIEPARFARGEVNDPDLGTPEQPGSFAVTAFGVARRLAEGAVEPVYPPPADLVIRTASQDGLEAVYARPRSLAGGLQCSGATVRLAVLPERERGKPASGWWLRGEGWRRYLAGERLDPERHLIRTASLWNVDPRVGVGLDAAKRAAAEGRLFTVQAVAMAKREHGGDPPHDAGFVARVAGARLPERLTLRLGGDGRAALATRVQAGWAETDWEALARSGKVRVILATPALFGGGWLPTGATRAATGEIRFELHGVRGRLVCAAVPRAEVVSGWDLAHRRPKPAQRAAPSGSVYWLELEPGVSGSALRALVESGLWEDPCPDPSRRAEGFNRCALAAWTEEAHDA